MPSVPAAWGSSSAPRPQGCHGGPGGSRTRNVSARVASTVVGDVGGLGAGEGAHRVDEPTARPQRPRGADDERDLQGDELGGRRPDPPAGLGSSAQHAEPGAGRVDERPVHRGRRDRQRPAVGEDRVHRVEAEAARRARDEAEPARVHVDRDDGPVGDGLGEAGGLPAGRGGDVEHLVPGLGVDDGDDGLAGLVLGGGAPFGDRGERPRVADAAHPSASGTTRPRVTVAPVAASSSASVAGSTRRRFGRSVRTGASFWAASAARASSTPRSVSSRSSTQSG